MKRLTAIALFGIICLLAIVSTASASFSDLLVPTFGDKFNTDGIAPITGVTELHAMAQQADGKIVAVGIKSNDFWVARYDLNGDLDPTFDNDGQTTIEFGFDDNWGENLVIQDDGKIIVVGTRYDSNSIDTDFAVARVLPNGDLDTSFASGGKFTYDQNDSAALANSKESAYAVTLQPDGKILVAGGGDDCGLLSCNDEEFLVLRLNPNGTLDTTFHNDGVRRLGMGDSDRVEKIFVLPDGRIQLVGTRYGSYYFVASALLHADGTSDTTYHYDGNNSSAAGRYRDGVRLADGSLRVIIEGEQANYLARIDENGFYDNNFSSTNNLGIALNVEDQSFTPFTLRQLPDGKLLMGGVDDSNRLYLLRMTIDGQMDSTFGNGLGYVVNNTSSTLWSHQPIFGLISGPNGMLTVGTQGSPDQMFRFYPDGSLQDGGRKVLALSDGDDVLNNLAVDGNGDVYGVGYADDDGVKHWHVQRFHGDGRINNAFSMNPVNNRSEAHDVVIDNQGNIVVVGTDITSDWSATWPVVRRYNNLGNEVSPAYSGYLANQFNGFRAVAKQPDGKIVAAGYHSSEFYLVRLNSDLSLDSSFGNNGEVKTDVGDFAQVYDVTVLPSGGIVAVGIDYDALSGTNDILIVRYTATGQVEATHGILNPTWGTNATANAVVGLPDNSFVTIGEIDGRAVIWKNMPSGVQDTEFFNGPVPWLNLTTEDSEVNDLVLQADGKFLVIGCSHQADRSRTLAVRVTSTGDLDATFVGNGRARYETGPSGECGLGAAYDASTHEIVVGGFSEGNYKDNKDWMMMRFDGPQIIAPAITAQIAQSGMDDVRLSWTHEGQNEQYKVYYHATNPYFAPNDAGSIERATLSAPAFEYMDYGALTNGTNGYYVVVAENSSGSAQSGNLAEFSFPLN